MQATDTLHRIIQSLNPHEKRYFKVFSQRIDLKDGKDYMLLFDLLSKMEEYDEEKLKKKIKKASLLKMLPQTKNYLKDLILQSMRSYSQSTSIINTVQELINDAWFYKQKGLNDLRLKTLKKANELAEQYELTFYRFPIMSKLRIAETNFSGRDPLSVSEEFKIKEKQLLQDLIIETEITQIREELIAEYGFDGLLNNAEKIKAIQCYKQHPLLLNYENMHTFSSKFSFLKAYSLIHKFENENESALKYHYKIIELFEAYPHIKANDQYEYRSALINFLGACHRAGIYDQFLPTIEKIQALPLSSFDDEMSLFHLLSNSKLLFCLNTYNYDMKAKVETEIFEGLKKYGSKMRINSKVILYYNLMIAAFVSDNFNSAFDYAMQLLNLESKSRNELQAGARLLLLIIHFELDNLQLLDSLLRSTSRSLKNEERFDAFEKYLCSAIKKLMQTLPEKHSAVFQELHNDLVLLAETKTPTYKFVILTEVSAWVLSHLNKTSIRHELTSAIRR